MLLGHIILTGIVAAAAVGVIAYVISGMITKEKIKLKVNDDVIIKSINNCTNTITLEDLDNQTYEVRGDSISDDLYEGQMIYV